MTMRADSSALMRVLVVDDDPIFRSLVSAKLVRHAREIVEAEDGTAGWSMLVRDSFDLMVVDLEMPGMSGIDLIRCIRGHPKKANLPIIVVSSRDPAEAVREALESGASAYLTKPVNWTAFQSHVDAIGRLYAAAERGRRLETIAKSALGQLSGVRTKLKCEVSSCAAGIAGVARQALIEGRNDPSRLAAALEAIMAKAQEAEVGVTGLVALMNLESLEASMGPLQSEPPLLNKAS